MKKQGFKHDHYTTKEIKHDNVIITDCSKDSQYKSQRANKYYPHSTCNVTSYAMMFDYLGHADKIMDKYNNPKLELPDLFFEYIRDEDKVKVFYSRYATEIPPEQIHDVLAYAGSLLLSSVAQSNTKISFSVSTPLDTIVHALEEGKPVVVSGRFPYWSKVRQGEITIGHIVCLVGTVRNKETGKLLGFLIDDPYGNYKTLYEDINGNNVFMDLEDFETMIRREGDGFWAHVPYIH